MSGGGLPDLTRSQRQTGTPDDRNVHQLQHAGADPRTTGRLDRAPSSKRDQKIIPEFTEHDDLI